ncbi:MAG: sulfotransferase [Kiritimatiellae bacterium]|nr:sulfotransferase [Kiritimatiellia bacterium]
MKKRPLRELRRRVFSRYLINLQASPSGAVLLAGSGRSGTTWIADVLNHDNAYRLMFEPFHPRETVRLGFNPGFGYMRPDELAPERLAYAEKVFSGRVRSDWTDSQNRRFWCQETLIKDICAPLSHKWLRNAFPDLRIILAIRHPCAVVTSRIKMGWSTDLDVFRKDPAFVEDHLADILQDLEPFSTPFEQHLIQWCIDTIVPLRQLNPGDAQLVLFEHACLQPRQEFSRLLTFLGRPVPDDLETIAQRLSFTTQRTTQPAQPTDFIASWQKHVSEEQLECAMKILALFGLDRLYGPSPEPCIGADETNRLPTSYS